jgi:hypothetical protein
MFLVWHIIIIIIIIIIITIIICLVFCGVLNAGGWVGLNMLPCKMKVEFCMESMVKGD